jgi:outer membrane protein assembly factor BamB
MRAIGIGATAALLVTMVIGGVAAAPADWPQLGQGPAHTGYQHFETALSPVTVQDITKLWQRDLTPTADPYNPRIYTAPVVSSGSVFVAPMRPHESHGALWAIDRRTGERLWKTIDVGTLDAAPAVSRGTVLVNASYPFEAIAFDAESGATLWRHRTTTPGLTDGENFQGAAPVLAHGVAVVSSTGDTHEGEEIGRLWAFDLATGEVMWKRPQTGGHPAIAGRTVFAGRGGRLLAIDLVDGSVRWIVRLADRDGMVGAPAIEGGTVYTTIYRERRDAVVAVGASNGRVRWRTPTRPTPSPGAPPLVAPNLVVVETLNGRLVALRRHGGAITWVGEIDPRTRHVHSCTEGACASPAAANGVVFAVAGERLRAFRLFNGQPLWSRRIGNVRYSIGIASSPAISRGTVYVGSDSGHLFAFGRGPA